MLWIIKLCRQLEAVSSSAIGMGVFHIWICTLNCAQLSWNTKCRKWGKFVFVHKFLDAKKWPWSVDFDMAWRHFEWLFCELNLTKCLVYFDINFPHTMNVCVYVLMLLWYQHMVQLVLQCDYHIRCWSDLRVFDNNQLNILNLFKNLILDINFFFINQYINTWIKYSNIYTCVKDILLSVSVLFTKTDV